MNADLRNMLGWFMLMCAWIAYGSSFALRAVDSRSMGTLTGEECFQETLSIEKWPMFPPLAAYAIANLAIIVSVPVAAGMPGRLNYSWILLGSSVIALTSVLCPEVAKLLLGGKLWIASFLFATIGWFLLPTEQADIGNEWAMAMRRMSEAPEKDGSHEL